MRPEPIPLRDKLYGNLEELRRTALWQPGGAEEDSCFHEDDRHLCLVYDQEKE